MTVDAAPGPRTSRIESLDVLRGLAVLGIFMVNVQAFAMTPFGYANPTLEADFGPAGQAVWTTIVALFEMKFITLFSALFGAGVVLMSGEGEDPERSRLHVRRMQGLLVIGLVHAYGFWYGDILAPYAVAGLIVTGARAWSARSLAVAGLGLSVLTSVLIGLAVLGAAAEPPDKLADIVADAWAPPPDELAKQVALFAAAWPARIAGLAELVFERQVSQLVYFTPRLVGVMMLGMALYKSGFFTGGWRIRHLALAATLAPLGALVSWGAAQWQIAAGFDYLRTAPAQAAVFLVSLPQALGYAALVMLACRPGALRWLRAPFAAAGRMALSVYLGCTLLGCLVFYGPPGLGRIDAMSRLDQLHLVLWTWLAILVIAPVWLAAFRYGPLEWAWRSATYGRLQPFVRR